MGSTLTSQTNGIYSEKASPLTTAFGTEGMGSLKALGRSGPQRLARSIGTSRAVAGKTVVIAAATATAWGETLTFSGTIVGGGTWELDRSFEIFGSRSVQPLIGMLACKRLVLNRECWKKAKGNGG